MSIFFWNDSAFYHPFLRCFGLFFFQCEFISASHYLINLSGDQFTIIPPLGHVFTREYLFKKKIFYLTNS